MASATIEPPGGLSCGVPTEPEDGLCHRHVPGLGSVTSVTSVTPSCTRSVGILGLGPLCFLFFVFPSRPLPLTPRAVHLPGD